MSTLKFLWHHILYLINYDIISVRLENSLANVIGKDILSYDPYALFASNNSTQNCSII